MQTSEHHQLVDIRDVEIDMALPCHERKKRYLEQIKDPYRFRYKQLTVSISFKGDDTLENKVIAYLKNRAQIFE